MSIKPVPFNKTRLASSCSDCQDCPVIDLDHATGLVTVHDPEAPERGKFEMSKAEYDRLKASMA